jgi:hypothetical protein
MIFSDLLRPPIARVSYHDHGNGAHWRPGCVSSELIDATKWLL